MQRKPVQASKFCLNLKTQNVVAEKRNDALAFVWKTCHMCKVIGVIVTQIDKSFQPSFAHLFWVISDAFRHWFLPYNSQFSTILHIAWLFCSLTSLFKLKTLLKHKMYLHTEQSHPAWQNTDFQTSETTWREKTINILN